MRERLQEPVLAALREYTGKVVTISSIVQQLRRQGTIVTRETVRKWMLEARCRKVQGTHGYYVPTAEEQTNARSA